MGTEVSQWPVVPKHLLSTNRTQLLLSSNSVCKGFINTVHTMARDQKVRATMFFFQPLPKANPRPYTSIWWASLLLSKPTEKRHIPQSYPHSHLREMVIFEVHPGASEKRNSRPLGLEIRLGG